MKILAALLVALLVGCATPDPRIADYLAWESSTKQMALDGQLPWTSYYTQAYDRLGQLPPSLDRNLRMQGFAQVIPFARQYEAGLITREQFYDQRRLLAATMNQTAAQAYAQQQANERADMANRLQIMQALQPRPVALPPVGNPTVNCTSRTVLNTVHTSCL